MKKTLLLVCGAALVFAAGFQVQGNTIVANAGLGDAASIFHQTGAGSTVGYDFTVGSTPLIITALGFWDGPEKFIDSTQPPTGSIGNGLVRQHMVGLWDNSGNLLAQATVVPGTSDILIAEFRYAGLLVPTNPGPVILSANTTYVLGASFVNLDPDTSRLNFGSNEQPSFDPAVIRGNYRFSVGGFAFPSGENGPGSWIGPNAIFTLVTNGNGVPEGGSTLLMVAIAIVGLLGLQRVVRDAVS